MPDATDIPFTVSSHSDCFPESLSDVTTPMADQGPTNLEELLDRIKETTENANQVSIGEVLDVVGYRSFGPLLLVAGLITVMPIVGDIPGVPTVMAVFVTLIAGQMLFHREHPWLPDWLLRRSVAADKLLKAVGWIYRPAQFVDRGLRPRLKAFTHRTAAHAIAVACILISAVMPLLEVIPFSANLAGSALTAFGLSLIAEDGLFSLLAFVFTTLTFGVAAYSFF